MRLTTLEDFFTNLHKYLKKEKEIKFLLLNNPLEKEHLVWSIEKLYLKYYFKRFELKIDDIYI